MIFLVDCRKSLFDKLPNSDKVSQKSLFFKLNLSIKKSGFEQVLTAYKGFMKAKIISSENDKIGLVFYNTVLSFSL